MVSSKKVELQWGGNCKREVDVRRLEINDAMLY